MKRIDFNYPEFEKLNPSNCREASISIHYPEFKEYLYNRYPDIPFPEKIYLFYHNCDKPGTCKMCGNKTEFLSFKRGYREFCSHKCMNSCKEVQERKKITCQKNYGTDNPMNSPEVREKIKQTNLEKYGVENCFQSQELMEKARETCRKKYGTDYALQSEGVKQKIIDSKRKNVYEKYPNIIRILSGNDGDNGDIYVMKCIDDNCNKCKDQVFEIPSSRLYERIKIGADICTIRTPLGFRIKNTGIENFIHKILDERSVCYETTNRKLLSGKELDIYIPEKKLAIECNGVFWHSRVYMNYHHDKWLECREKGIYLLNIWEDWITRKPDIVKNIILEKLETYNTQIDAGDCLIKEVSAAEAKNFLNENHILGYCTSTIRYGLYYNKELVSIMSFKKVPNDSWKILRYCTKLNTHINDAAEKIIQYFRSNHIGMIEIEDLHDVSEESLYKLLGFKQEDKIITNCWYIHCRTHERYPKSQISKNKLVKNGCNSFMTEDEILSADYFKIYDSGSTKYILS